MAKSNSKEAQYQALLQELGVYSSAFDPVIHMLCIQERELSRAMKAWKETAADGKAPLITDPLYGEIAKLRRDILARQDALGLTPKALLRLRRQTPPSDSAPPPSTGNQAFTDLMDRIKEATSGSSA